MENAQTPGRVTSARDWASILNTYRGSDPRRSALELAVTVCGFVVAWLLMWATLGVGYWLTLLFALPAGGFLVRLFMIQHDCGHGAFFRNRRTNDWIGRAIGTLTLTPYDTWRRTHNIHHASSGNLEQRGIGDVKTLTVCEYLASSRWQRFYYRLYRHPLVMFGLGPAYLFLVQHRVPVGLMLKGWQPWVSTMATNAAIALVVLAMVWLVGAGEFLLVHVPITLLAASIGVWLFYVQHQFENTTWAAHSDWNLHDAALHGSSHYDLPSALRWFTANIGVHHVHHLCSRIPYYRLPEVLREHPELSNIGRLTLRESLASVRLVLWDENHQHLVSFGELRKRNANLL